MNCRITTELLTSPFIAALVDYLQSGGSFATITEARAFAAEHLGQPVLPGSPLAKTVDEAIEAALVRVAQHIVASADTPHAAYRQLVDLHDRQPALNVRSSTSVAQQAYSTPLPIAYLASTLAEIDPTTTVYEPSAGHGALLLGGGQAAVNELNPARAADLREQGYTVTEFDASAFVPAALHDVVIANPPFGTVTEVDGRTKSFFLPEFAPFRTTQIDQAIALKSLKAMKPDGRAVLILGGKLGVEEDKRSDRYNTQDARAFYYTLYQNFGVIDHFSIWGDLYKKQGAGFPIDVIVIAGRGASLRPLPAAEVPRIYRSFDELGELFDARRRQSYQQPDERLRPGSGRENLGGAGAANGNQPDGTALPGIAGTAAAVVDAGMGSRGRRDDDPEAAGASRPGLGTASPLPAFAQIGAVANLGTVFSAGERDDSAAAGAAGRELSGTTRNGSRANLVAEGIIRSTRPAAEPGGMAGGSDARPVVEAAKQVTYRPKSTARPVGTLVPRNMETAVQQALTRLERQVGRLDDYVVDRLGYGTSAELHQHFSAEQVDAIALAVSNIERGSGFVLGDQTGIGKGRVVAGIIRYASITGRTPLFITKDTPLYADMIRDLRDIGMPGFTPFVTNENLKLPLPDGRTLTTDTTRHRQTMQALGEEGHLRGYDAIFTTYNQLQTVGGKEPYRRTFLRQFAPNTIIILDESHEAGGSTGDRTPAKSGASNRADFTRALIREAQGVLYSSATYAKDPAVMDLYARTDMTLALGHAGHLTELVASGGVPLQQTLASMLAESGQYIRRERSFAGVRFEPVLVPVDRDMAEDISRIMAGIMEFDRHKSQAVKGMDASLKAEAKALSTDNSTGLVGASSTNFTSLMHNVVSQMLLGLKTEETVQKALALLRQPDPEKPVIALSNTMGSLIQDNATAGGLQPGAVMNLSFGDVLRRYLERSRDVIIGNPWGEKSRHRLTDAELGVEAIFQFDAIREWIDATDFSTLPISPIDYFKHRLEQEGYRVGEVTGRSHIGVYAADGSLTYQRRSAAETAKKAAVETVRKFNAGEIDVIVLNRSGSTGISLHASEQFADQRPRHMIVLQAEPDINQFMQMLGRIHRTGQVVMPSFTLLMADLPAEKRPGAVLAKKMASLNANTTAARSSGITLDVPDFMNEYGDRVAFQVMENHLDIHEKLDYPLESWEGETIVKNAMQKVTGRIPLLPIAEQEALYDLIEREYNQFVAAQDAMGESILEASTLNLDAKTLMRMEVVPADAGSRSPFTSAVYAEIVDAKTPRKPYTTGKVLQFLKQVLDMPLFTELLEDEVAPIRAAGQARSAAAIAELRQHTEKLSQQAGPEVTAVFDKQFEQVSRLLQEFPIGQPVCLTTESRESYWGMVASIEQRGDATTLALSSWDMQLYLADPVQELTLPLSRLNSGRDGSVALTAVEADANGISVYDLFDLRQKNTREKRQIFTGNLLRAFEKFSGKMINFTDAAGNIRPGLLTPRGFDAEAELKRMPVTMPTIENATRFLTEVGGQLKTGDKCLTVKSHKNQGFVLQTPKTKSEGGRYFLDEGLLAAAGGEFYSVADRMECGVSTDRLEAVLIHLMRERGYTIAAFEERDAARAMLGIELPSFEETPELEPAQPAVPALPDLRVPKYTSRRAPEALSTPERQLSVFEPAPFLPLPSSLNIPGFAGDSVLSEQVADQASPMPDVVATQTLADIHAWARAARDLDLGFERRRLIQEWGKAFKTEFPSVLPPEVEKLMQADLARYQPYQERGISLMLSARLLLAEAGQLDMWGQVTFRHKAYECTQKEDILTVQHRSGNKVEIILQASGDTLLRTTVKPTDERKFAALAEPCQMQYVQKLQAFQHS